MWTTCREWMMLFFSCGPGRWKLCKSSKKNDINDISCWENTNLWYFRKLSKLISQLNSIEISPVVCKKPVKCQGVSTKQRSVGWDWRAGQLWSDHCLHIIPDPSQPQLMTTNSLTVTGARTLRSQPLLRHLREIFSLKRSNIVGLAPFYRFTFDMVE